VEGFWQGGSKVKIGKEFLKPNSELVPKPTSTPRMLMTSKLAEFARIGK
jgi:hypothetical protein